MKKIKGKWLVVLIVVGSLIVLGFLAFLAMYAGAFIAGMG